MAISKTGPEATQPNNREKIMTIEYRNPPITEWKFPNLNLFPHYLK
jgi:hypothetical protein